MKLSPTISNWIRRFILKQGAAKSALFITILSVLFSVLIAKLVSSLMPSGSGNFNLATRNYRSRPDSASLWVHFYEHVC